MITDPAGRTGEPFAMAVELGKVQEFARATKSTNPAYFGQPGDAVTAPATFLITATFWQRPESNPWFGVDRNLERVLHGEQEFIFHGAPPKSGDVLEGQARIDRVYEKEGRRGGSMRFTDAVTEFRDAGGRLIAEARSTSIETSKPTGA